MSSLFTEILDNMVSFACTFLKIMPIERSNKASGQLYSLLFDKEQATNEESNIDPAAFASNHTGGFTLTEKLTILV
jgi:hypothetical protein